MSDEEEFEELPMIFFNSSASNASTFSMPSASALAEQRARELERERELQLLRERHAPDERAGSSSGSEVEAAAGALAAAVTQLSVASPPPARLLLADLLPALARALPAAAPLLQAPRPGALVAGAAALLAQDELAWSDEDACAAGALLAAAALAHDAGPRAAALRALHTLLDYRASHEQARALGAALLRALPAPAARLELCDALRSGAGAGADRLAAELLEATLLELLDAAPDEALARALEAGWRRLPPAESYRALQLVGRRLSAAGPRDSAELLAALSGPPAPPHLAMERDALKVSVGLQKLRMLFEDAAAMK